MSNNSIVNRALYKGRQIAAFYRHSSTPLALALDSLKIKKSPFVAISRDGLKLSLLPRCGESFTFYENIIENNYLKNGIGLKPGSTVVDIGAHVGAFAVLAGSIIGAHGRVIAFEPVAKTFERLKENVALNGLANVDCHRAAIDSREGTITLQVPRKSVFASAHVVKRIGDDGPNETVPCHTLDRVIKDFQIDRINLLKVDCEGSEHGIFDTLSADAAARIDQIAMDVHPVGGVSTDRLYERLATLGFMVRRGAVWVAFKAIPVLTLEIWTRFAQTGPWDYIGLVLSETSAFSVV